MTNLVKYKGLNSNRLHSSRIWADCPIDALQNGEAEGHYWFDDFESLDAWTEGDDVGAEGPKYYLVGSDGVTLTKQADTDYGTARVAGNDADEDGFVMVYGNAAGWARFGPTDMVWAEARLSQSLVANSNAVNAFGFLEVNVVPTSVITQVDATGVLDVSEDFVAWRSIAADGDAIAPIYQLGGQTLGNVTASGGTAASPNGYQGVLTASTFKKFGIKWNGPKLLLEYFIDGARVAYYTVPASSTTFPFVNHLSLFWANKATGGTETNFDNDWWAGAYLTL